MHAIDMANVGGRGRGFGSGGGINRRSGGGRKPERASKMIRLSGQDFVQLGARRLLFYTSVEVLVGY